MKDVQLLGFLVTPKVNFVETSLSRGEQPTYESLVLSKSLSFQNRVFTSTLQVEDGLWPIIIPNNPGDFFS